MATPAEPDSTAIRTALWRAMHVEIDSAPHVLEDIIGLKLSGLDDSWRDRPDMDPQFTRTFRASMVARTRFVEDQLAEKVAAGVGQYVILGAGLDTFVQRCPETAQWLQVFEVDQPGPQSWKRERLDAIAFGVPDWLHLVPVDFEAGENWGKKLEEAGFDANQPALVGATGLSMYLTRQSIIDIFRTISRFAQGSTLMMTFMLPLEQLPSNVRPGIERAVNGARASGTPFLSFFEPEEILTLARENGFAGARHVSPADLNDLYFRDRPDGLALDSGEEFLIAWV